MKIRTDVIIQNKNISIYNANDFEATYKEKKIIITSNHEFDPPQYNHLTRYLINVIDIKSGKNEFQKCDDFHTMMDAIRIAVIGSNLIK